MYWTDGMHHRDGRVMGIQSRVVTRLRSSQTPNADIRISFLERTSSNISRREFKPYVRMRSVSTLEWDDFGI